MLRRVACAVLFSATFWSITHSVALASPTELITNGSFEVVNGYVGPGGSAFVAAGDSSFIAGWLVGGTTADINNENFFRTWPLNPANKVYDGVWAVDLEGSPGPGSISQSFSTVAGQEYKLAFAYSRNIFHPESYAASPSAAIVSVDGAANLLKLDITSGLTGADLIWTPVKLAFVADSATTTLTFASNNGNGYYGGIQIDAVSVTVPEPSSLVVGCLGGVTVLCLLASAKKRRLATKR
jgi:hypothetical protein